QKMQAAQTQLMAARGEKKQDSTRVRQAEDASNEATRAFHERVQARLKRRSDDLLASYKERAKKLQDPNLTPDARARVLAELQEQAKQFSAGYTAINQGSLAAGRIPEYASEIAWHEQSLTQAKRELY